MFCNGIFIGTISELADMLLRDYSADRSFNLPHLIFSPSEDITAGGKFICQSQSGDTLSVYLCGSDDTPIDNTCFFSEECFNGFKNRRLFRGQVYQLTFIAAYRNNADAAEVFYPEVSGKWAQWESYWRNNTPSEDCTVFAAVNLLEGRLPYEDAKGYEHVFRYEIMPEFNESRRGQIIQYTGQTDASYIKGFYYMGGLSGWEQLDVQPQPDRASIPLYSSASQVPLPCAENESEVFLWAGSDMCTVINEATWSAELYPGRVYCCKLYNPQEGYRWHDVIGEQLSYKQYKSRYFYNVAISDWQADSTYTDYPYRGTASLPGVSSSLMPTVVFNVDEAVSGNYAPVAVSDSNKIYIYGKVDTAIIIPVIKCEVAV